MHRAALWSDPRPPTAANASEPALQAQRGGHREQRLGLDTAAPRIQVSATARSAPSRSCLCSRGLLTAHASFASPSSITVRACAHGGARSILLITRRSRPCWLAPWRGSSRLPLCRSRRWWRPPARG